MALGLQILHFRSFLEQEKIEITDDIFQELQRLKSCQTPIFFIHDEKLKELCANYAKFEEQTLHGLEDFKKGFFGIKRTGKPFSRQPIDLTLEQTINADAARRLTGITHLTDSIAARQRWARSHDIRSTIITHVLEEIGINKKQDISAELQPSNIKKNCEQLEKFVKSFDQYINPFSAQLPPNQLFNISSGKAASTQVEDFLLNVEKIGDDLRKAFISECSSDINRILSYPITPVPLSLCHLDGGIHKTDKSALAKSLEAKIDHDPPSHADVYLIDGFFILHAMKEVPRTFGNISKKFLQMITKFSASRIDVIFDQYWYPSIKDNERSLRHEAPLIDYSIYGPDQIRSSDFTKEMRNTKFKEALIEFFTIHWATDDVAPFIGNKLIHLNFKNCYSYRSNDGKVESSIVEDLCCKSHEEADSKIIFHACSIIDQSNIVIRGSDTDILIIMLGNMVNLKNPSSHIWMLTGTGNNESIWKNAHANEPTSLNPLEYGWMEMENRYVFKWFEGDQLPCFVSDLILNPEESDLEDEDDLSLSEDDSEDEN
ncbi:uncharacterized protein [Neodiprion pinetum]